MPQKIIIIRHGQTDSNRNRIVQGHLDIPLNQEGIKQAQITADKLQHEQFDIIYSSDLQRAFHTAKILAGNKKNEIIKTSLLRERYFGKFQGIPYVQVEQMIVHYSQLGSKALRGKEHLYDVETDDQMKARAHEFRQQLYLHKNKTILIISHGGFIRIFLKYMGIMNEDDQRMMFENAKPFILVKKDNTYILEE